MESSDIKELLHIIINKIGSENITWRLEGSANLLLQGVKTTVRDLDLTTDDNGIRTLRKELKEFIVKDYYKESIGRLLVCSIKGFEVEISSYEDENYSMFDKVRLIEFHGLKIPALPLFHAKRFYELIGRKEKVSLINKFL